MMWLNTGRDVTGQESQENQEKVSKKESW